VVSLSGKRAGQAVGRVLGPSTTYGYVSTATSGFHSGLRHRFQGRRSAGVLGRHHDRGRGRFASLWCLAWTQLLFVADPSGSRAFPPCENRFAGALEGKPLGPARATAHEADPFFLPSWVQPDGRKACLSWTASWCVDNRRPVREGRSAKEETGAITALGGYHRPPAFEYFQDNRRWLHCIGRWDPAGGEAYDLNYPESLLWQADQSREIRDSAPNLLVTGWDERPDLRRAPRGPMGSPGGWRTPPFSFTERRATAAASASVDVTGRNGAADFAILTRHRAPGVFLRHVGRRTLQQVANHRREPSRACGRSSRRGTWERATPQRHPGYRRGGSSLIFGRPRTSVGASRGLVDRGSSGYAAAGAFKAIGDFNGDGVERTRGAIMVTSPRLNEA